MLEIAVTRREKEVWPTARQEAVYKGDDCLPIPMHHHHFHRTSTGRKREAEKIAKKATTENCDLQKSL